MSASATALERIAESLERLERRELEAERELRAARRANDPLRRLAPRKLGWAAFMQAIPGLAAQFRPLPDGYATREGDIFTVACPCGERPTVQREHSTECQCGRLFLASDTVYVASAAN